MENNREERRSYIEVFQDKIAAFRKGPGEETLTDLFRLLYDGLLQDCALPCAAKMAEGGGFELAYAVRADGTRSLAVLSRLDGERFPVIADVRLRTLLSLVMEQENCDGIIIDPADDDRVFIPKEDLALLLQ